jgi:hypothetical protein
MARVAVLLKVPLVPLHLRLLQMLKLQALTKPSSPVVLKVAVLKKQQLHHNLQQQHCSRPEKLFLCASMQRKQPRRQLLTMPRLQQQRLVRLHREAAVKQALLVVRQEEKPTVEP